MQRHSDSIQHNCLAEQISDDGGSIVGVLLVVGTRVVRQVLRLRNFAHGDPQKCADLGRGCQIDGFLAVGVADVHVCSLVNQNAHTVQVALPAGGVQRRVAQFVLNNSLLS